MKLICEALNVIYALVGAGAIIVLWRVAWDVFKPLNRK